MNKLHRLAIRLLHDNKGQDMVEYALLAGFIAVAAGALLPPVALRTLVAMPCLRWTPAAVDTTADIQSG